MLNLIKNLSIRNKLLFSNGLFIVLSCLLSVFSAVCIFSLKAENDHLNTVLLPSVNQISELTDKYWMTRIRLLLVSLHKDEGKRRELKKQIREFSQLYFDDVAGYEKYIKTPEDKRKFEDLAAFTKTEKADLEKLLPLVESNQYDAALAWQGTHGGAQYDNFDESSEALGEYNQKLIAENHEATSRTFNLFIMIFIAANCITIALMILTALWYGNLIGKPIKEIQQAVKIVANGDLSYSIPLLGTKDELGELTKDIEKMTQNLSGVINSIKNNATSLLSTSSELSSASSQLKHSAENVKTLSLNSAAATEDLDSSIRTVVSAVEISSTNLKGVSSSSQQVDKNVQNVSKASSNVASNLQNIALSADEASTSVNTISAAMEQMSSTLNEVSRNTANAAQIAHQAETTAASTRETFGLLQKSANEIDNVLEVIQSIASQTNLLALNATIEAASAGDAGKGFAVVANEVKELARQSAEAAQGIRKRIEEMQANTSSAITAINDISKVIDQMNSITTTIASAVEEQTLTANEISQNIVTAAKASNDVYSNVQEAAELANEVNSQAQEASDSVVQIAKTLQELDMGANEIVQTSQRTLKMAECIEEVALSSTEAEETASTVAKSSSELSTLAVSLQSLVQQFKTAS